MAVIPISREVALNRLREVDEEDRRFYCCDGRVLRSLADLGAALATMPEDVYRYHHNEQKQDFASWVRDVLGDTTLARDLVKAKSPARAARLVQDRIGFLRSKL